LIETKLITWDETPKMNRLWFETFDRALRDIPKTKNEENSKKKKKLLVVRLLFWQVILENFSFCKKGIHI